MASQDPAIVIKRGLSQAMVYYYPVAGRIREGPGGKLSIECNGEGILFFEADADVSLEELGTVPQPPFSFIDKINHDIWESVGIIDSPMVVVQVTRLSCGGFICTTMLNHTVCDGFGIGMFYHAAAEMSRGSSAPTILPVWERERLHARAPPRVTCVHHEFDDPPPDDDNSKAPKEPLSIRSIFFTRKDLEGLRAQLPAHLRKSATTFDILTAYLWRCRTAALRLAPDEETRLIIAVNARGKLNPPLSEGFYGNAIILPATVTKAGKLMENKLEYGVELVRKVKAMATEEYVRSTADLLVLKGRPHYTVHNTYLVADIRYAGHGELDWGWGKPSFGGPADVGEEFISFLLTFKNGKGENGILVPICLPESTMESFMIEFKKMVHFTE